jgi:hypothetical protein
MNEELNTPTEPAKAVIRRNTEEAQGGGRNFDVFEDSSPMPSLITPRQTPLVEIRQTITVRAGSANQFLNK